MEIDKQIIKVLWNSIVIYKDKCLKIPEFKEFVMNDCNCEDFEEDTNYWIYLYLNQACNEKKGISFLHNKLLNGNINKKKINKFIYSFLKLTYKTENKLWSMAELEEFQVPLENIGNKSSNYKFF